jgi:N-acetylglucosaminyldiphosphoundecaprenol N-acetyl-beta-D-mannosaminyltransferase
LAHEAGNEVVHVAGLPVVRANIEPALDLIWEDAAVPRGRVYVLVNGYSAALRWSVPAYAAVLEADTTVGLPDGAPLAFGARLLGLGSVGRSPGPDLLEAAAARAAADRTPMFLLGGGPGVVDELSSALRKRHPELVIAGTLTPPHAEWTRTESIEMCGRVRESEARLLCLGVSAPKQEVWAHDYLNELGLPVLCVGAAFDFLAGRKPRAPKWMRTIGMEWFFRLATEPRRLWKRYLLGNAVFIADFVRHRSRKPGLRPSAP